MMQDDCPELPAFPPAEHRDVGAAANGLLKVADQPVSVALAGLDDKMEKDSVRHGLRVRPVCNREGAAPLRAPSFDHGSIWSCCACAGQPRLRGPVQGGARRAGCCLPLLGPPAARRAPHRRAPPRRQRTARRRGALPRVRRDALAQAG